MNEFAPSSRKVKMTKAQVRKYIKDMEEKRKLAQLKIEQEKLSWNFDKNNQKELEKIEKDLENIF